MRKWTWTGRRRPSGGCGWALVPMATSRDWWWRRATGLISPTGFSILQTVLVSEYCRLCWGWTGIFVVIPGWLLPSLRPDCSGSLSGDWSQDSKPDCCRQPLVVVGGSWCRWQLHGPTTDYWTDHTYGFIAYCDPCQWIQGLGDWEKTNLVLGS